MIGLWRKNILIYLHPDDHMMDMWQKDYVLQLDNWRKQWSGCSRTLQITVRSSNSLGHRLRRSLLSTGTVYRQPWKLPGACSGKVVTTTGDRHTESSTSGCELSSADGIRTVDASIPRGTAPAPAMAPATAAGAGDNDAVDKRLQRLGTETQSCPPPAVSPPAPKELEQLMCSFIAGQRRRPPRRQRPARRDWSDVLCFSCVKSGHAATRCPNLNDSFPFMQPGWQTEKTPGGFIMIPPRVAMDRRRAENGG